MFIWSMQVEEGTLGLHHKCVTESFYLIRLNEERLKKVSDNRHDNIIEGTHVIVKNHEDIHYKNIFYDYFKSLSRLDHESDDFNLDDQQNEDLNWLNQYKTLWKKYLLEEVRLVTNDNTNNFLELVLNYIFLHSAQLLADPYAVGSISENERKDIYFHCFSNRINILSLLMKHRDTDAEYKKIFIQTFLMNFNRFINFLEEFNFTAYMLPKELKKLLTSKEPNIYSEEKIISVDDLIQWAVSELLIVKKEIEGSDEENTQESLDLVNNLVSRVVNNFYLPRYALKSAKKKEITKSLSTVDRVNSYAPRLLASILIGFIPIVLTGEVNEWGVSHLNLPSLPLPIIVILGLCYFYLNIEIGNVLGYRNNSSNEKVNYIFGLGLAYSYGISVIGHIFFTSYSITADLATFQLWKFNIDLELLIFQGSMAFLLGLVLQAVWEDKPITQPL